MITFLSIIALIGLVVFVVGAIMWFAARNDTVGTATVARAGERVRNAVLLAVAGLTVWAIFTIIIGVIALVDAWT